MSEEIRNEMKRQAARNSRLTMTTRLAVVDGVDPDQHAVRVRLQPDNVLTGWIPVETISIGPTWAIHWLPEVDAQVKVEFQEGSGEAGVVTGCVYDDAHRPPAGVPNGAVWLVHTNARLMLNADGSIDVRSAVVRIGAIGAMLRRLVTDAFQALFNEHSHPSHGAPPSQQMTTAHLTTNLTAS